MPGEPPCAEQAGGHAQDSKQGAGQSHGHQSIAQHVTPRGRPAVAPRIVPLKIPHGHLPRPHRMSPVPEVALIRKIHAHIAIEEKPAERNHRRQNEKPNHLEIFAKALSNLRHHRRVPRLAPAMPIGFSRDVATAAALHFAIMLQQNLDHFPAGMFRALIASPIAFARLRLIRKP